MNDKVNCPSGGIYGFNYSFCEILLEKLKSLKEGKRVFLSTDCKELTTIAKSVIGSIEDQMKLEPFEGIGPKGRKKYIEKLIFAVEEFLNMFKVQCEPKE